MVGVPINDQDTFTAQLGLGMGGRYGNIVEQTETPGPHWLSVMPGRAYQGECAIAFTLQDTFYGSNGIAGRCGGRVNAFR